MKLRQLFCTHKEKRLLGYDVICDVFTHTVYEKRKVYECSRCGKRFYQIQESKSESEVDNGNDD